MKCPRAKLAEYDASILQRAIQVEVMIAQLDGFSPPSPELTASVRAVLISNLRLLRLYYTVIILNPKMFTPEEIRECMPRCDAIDKALSDSDASLDTLRTLGTEILMV